MTKYGQKRPLEVDLKLKLSKLQKSPRLAVKHWAFCLAYSVLFPVTNLLGGSWMMVGIIVSCPFLPLAYIGGMATVSLVHSDSFYMLGATLSIFAQMFVVVYCSLARKEAKQLQD
jgi:hypothetical protein